MIHDILLSCLSLSSKGKSMKGFLTSDTVGLFFHPAEKKMFAEILNNLNYYYEVVRFAKNFGDISHNNSDYTEAQEFACGFYLRSFAQGVGMALKDYYNEIAELELYVEKKKPHSLVRVYNALELQLPCIIFLRKLINDAKIQKLNGCKLLQNLHQQYDHGDYRMDRITIKVSKPVILAFLSHLSHWLLFGVIDDEHSEFFISYRTSNKNSLKSACDRSVVSCTSLSSASEEEIWQYGINFNQLPSFVSSVLAEKVLFVGQTALVFKMDRTKQQQSYKLKTKSKSSFCGDVSELWDGKEAEFVDMIENLNHEDMIDIFHLENVINQIKKHVSQRLSEIANFEDDLDRQMCLIKDFYLLGRGEFYYLLGRGEFYMEFLRQLAENSDGNVESTAKNYSRSFEIASNVMGITDDLENFSISVLQNTTDFDESCEFALLQNLHLKYIYKWPLNLLFSPTTIERYNTVFRFLLTVRKLQYDLEIVWANHKWAGKTSIPVNVKIMHFRNHLMFFLNNLQYYIQVDVLECQFSLLMNAINSKADFEEIQRAHSVFLANVLSQCFLLTDATDKKINSTQSTCHSHYPVYGTILDIFNICEKFSLLNSEQNLSNEAVKEVDRLEERFNISILGLIKLLNSIKSASSFGPLSQLLLRLDYNRWFSAKQKAKVTS